MRKFPLIFQRFMDATGSLFHGRSIHQKSHKIRPSQKKNKNKSKIKSRRKMTQLSRRINRR
jgi:hypothetical protein